MARRRAARRRGADRRSAPSRASRTAPSPTASPGSPVRIGAGCIIGHGAIVHGATIAAGCLIGMHATLLNGCEIGEQSIVGAQALVPERRSCPPRSLLHRAPARVVRQLTDEDLAPLAAVHERYSARGRLYTEQGLGADLSAFRGASAD